MTGQGIPNPKGALYAMAGFYSCYRKKKYLTWTAASTVAKIMRRRHDTPIQAYQCRFCNGFHTGSAVRFEPQRVSFYPGALTHSETVRALFESRVA